jgi:DNA-binding NarL/FixJ family response regulator
MTEHQLRPIELTVRRLRGEGLSHAEVAWRLRRSPGYVRRVETMSNIERSGAPQDAPPGGLRPLERCVLNALQGGSGYPEVASRLRRSPEFVARIEQLATVRAALGGQ